MKIAFVSDAIYPYMHGGKEKRLYEISTRLVTLGHEVHIYTMHWWDESAETVEKDGLVLHAISKKHEMYSGDRRSIGEGILFGLACFKLFKAKFDVVDVDHMPFFPIFSVWMVCVLRGKKLYGTWHEALTIRDWTSYMGIGGYVAALIETISIRLPDKITAASEQTEALLASYHKRTKRVSLVASGIDTKLMKKITPQHVRCDALYVGRLVKDKNVDMLVRAFSSIVAVKPDAQCTIIGTGIERANLEQLIDALDLRAHVTILGPVADAKDIYGYMKAAKVFVLPSVREGFGIVALEALGCGTPVVTINSSANAAKNLVTEGITGSVVNLDVEAITNAVLFWMNAKTNPTHISEQFVGYDWQVMATKQAEVYAS